MLTHSIDAVLSALRERQEKARRLARRHEAVDDTRQQARELARRRQAKDDTPQGPREGATSLGRPERDTPRETRADRPLGRLIGRSYTQNLDREQQIHRMIQEVRRFRADKNFQSKPFGKTADGNDMEVLTVEGADTLSVSWEVEAASQ